MAFGGELAVVADHEQVDRRAVEGVLDDHRVVAVSQLEEDLLVKQRVERVDEPVACVAAAWKRE